jgi:ketosteroid isomerase-like protein
MQDTLSRDDVEKAAIRKVLDDYVAAVEGEDLELYGRVVDHNPEMVNFGTGSEERIVGWDALKKVMEAQFAALTDTRVAVSDVSISILPGGTSAWATSLWVFKATMAGQALSIPVRCSWVLEQHHQRWVVVHFHKSVGMSG